MIIYFKISFLRLIILTQHVFTAKQKARKKSTVLWPELDFIAETMQDTHEFYKAYLYTAFCSHFLWSKTVLDSAQFRAALLIAPVFIFSKRPPRFHTWHSDILNPEKSCTVWLTYPFDSGFCNFAMKKGSLKAVFIIKW